MSWKRLPIVWKLFVALVATSVLTTGFLGLLVAYSMQDGFTRYLLQAELNSLDDVALALGKAHDGDHPDWPELRGSADAWAIFARKVHRRQPPPDAPPLADPSLDEDPRQLDHRLTLLGPDGSRLAGPSQRGAMIMQRPILAPGIHAQAPPIGWIALQAPLAGPGGLDAYFLRGQFISLAMASLLALVLSTLAALALACQIVAPLKVLSEQLTTLTGGDFTARIHMQRQDELGRLINQHNVLAAALEAAETAERQWITDTSHELQTPLAILRAEIEALQDGVRQPGEKAFADLHTSVMRLSRLVGDLNTLARMREGGLAILTQCDDLAEIIQDAVEAVSARAATQGLKVTSEIDGRLEMHCDRLRIRQLIDNLLENSRRYTTAPGTVMLRAGRVGSSIVMTIDDSAPQPPAASLEHLFDRFYRVEPSRSREHGGSGLGLSICKAIVNAHGGSIEAHPSQLGGLLVKVTVPAGCMTTGAPLGGA